MKKSSTLSELSKPVGMGGNSTLGKRIKKHIPFYIMIIPVVVCYILFSYGPMFNIDIAFYEFGLMGKGEFIGLENFRRMFSTPKFGLIFTNTLVISLTRLAINMVLSMTFAILLNEIAVQGFKKLVQTAVYLPHFLSWVIVASLFTMILSPQSGVTGPIYNMLGLNPENPLTNEKLWRPLFYFIGSWKEIGWGAIIYLASITSIDPTLYEAAAIDGAGRWKQTKHITLPVLASTALVVLILNLAKVLNVFEPIFVLQNALVYNVSDVIGTYTYRVGLVDRDYSYSTAIGLFRSVISLILITIANYMSKKIRGRGII